MTRALWAVLVLGSILGPSPASLCVGAQHAIVLAAAQERSTPPGEWCQRRTANMSKKAHACACHQHDCDVDPKDPANLSAHTDQQCLNYCTVANCRCSHMDCP